MNRVRRETKRIPLAKLRAMTASANADRRLLAIMLMQKQTSHRKIEPYLTIGREMIEDADNDCRWQALILVGEYIQTKPKLVWETVKRYGISDDDDLRAGVACVLLEHLMEHHPRYRPQAKRISSKSKQFADTLSTCWDFNEGSRELIPARRNAAR